MIYSGFVFQPILFKPIWKLLNKHLKFNQKEEPESLTVTICHVLFHTTVLQSTPSRIHRPKVLHFSYFSGSGSRRKFRIHNIEIICVFFVRWKQNFWAVGMGSMSVPFSSFHLLELVSLSYFSHFFVSTRHSDWRVGSNSSLPIMGLRTGQGGAGRECLKLNTWRGGAYMWR